MLSIKKLTEMINQVETIISEYRKEHGDPPERMLGRYEYAHEEAREIKIFQGMCKDKS